MPNDSSTGGYLVPVAPSPPLEGSDLDAVLQQYVVGVTGLPGALVRPRWQPVVPKQPEADVTWCAIGVMRTKSDDYPAIAHDGAGEGQDNFSRHQELVVLASFYGPQAQAMAEQLRDGAYVGQNNDQLKASQMSLRGVGEVRAAPDLVNQQWIRRYDVEISLRRKIERVYPVRNIVSAEVNIAADNGNGGTVVVP